MASAISALSASPGASSSAASSSASSSSSSSLDAPSEEMFLKLLVSQLQNQDPLNPMDSTQFVSQLAQFSELEQVIGIRSDIESYMGNAAAGANAANANAAGAANSNPSGVPSSSQTQS